MLTLTGLIASLKLLLLSCKQAYYNDKEGLFFPVPGMLSFIKVTLICVRIRNSSSNSSQNGRYGKEQEENKRRNLSQ
ncbi:hypothetical protein L1987_88705 [Smallanthus sonchifolius]|nr:hypothetical protein L1987_88705 [Smallanthus sonchifolius]